MSDQGKAMSGPIKITWVNYSKTRREGFGRWANCWFRTSVRAEIAAIWFDLPRTPHSHPDWAIHAEMPMAKCFAIIGAYWVKIMGPLNWANRVYDKFQENPNSVPCITLSRVIYSPSPHWQYWKKSKAKLYDRRTSWCNLSKPKINFSIRCH